MKGKNKCESLGKYISELYRVQNSYLSKRFNKLNIGAGQYLFLLHLYKYRGATQEELTEMLKVDKATTTRAIKKLEDNGYVIRDKRKEDKRAYNVILTEKALDIEPKFFEVLDEWKEKLKEILTEEEENTLLKLLKKISISNLI